MMADRMTITKRQTNETLRSDMWRACDILRRDNNVGGVMQYTEHLAWLLFLKFLDEEEQERLATAFRGESQQGWNMDVHNLRITDHESLLETEVALAQARMKQRTKAITLPKPQMDDIMGLCSAAANPELPRRRLACT